MTPEERNRQLAPNVAAIVDMFREHFPTLKVVYCKDFVTGFEAGKPMEVKNEA